MTFLEARNRLLAALRAAGWSVATSGPRGPLKLPYATSPNGALRLWFKSRAVHYTMCPCGIHERSAARALAYGLDLRKEDPSKLAARLTARSRGKAR